MMKHDLKVSINVYRISQHVFSTSFTFAALKIINLHQHKVRGSSKGLFWLRDPVLLN